MAVSREIACEFYLNEGNCSKGRAGIFRGKCQTCSKYLVKKGTAPARKDLRSKILEDIRKREDKY